MQPLFLVFFLTCVVTLSAQDTSVSISEEASEDGYHFSLHRSDLTEDRMNTVFTEVSDGKVKGRFTGEIRTTLDNGVVLEMDTRRRRFTVDYVGDNEAALANAKQLAERLTERLNSESPH